MIQACFYVGFLTFRVGFNHLFTLGYPWPDIKVHDRRPRTIGIIGGVEHILDILAHSG